MSTEGGDGGPSEDPASGGGEGMTNTLRWKATPDSSASGSSSGIPESPPDEEGVDVDDSMRSLSELSEEEQRLCAIDKSHHLVAVFTRRCLGRGTFYFPRVSVMASTFRLGDELTPGIVRDWAERRILFPAARLKRPPGPEDAANAQAFCSEEINAVPMATGDQGAAPGWGAWLFKPAVDFATGAPGYIWESVWRPIAALSSYAGRGALITAGTTTADNGAGCSAAAKESEETTQHPAVCREGSAEADLDVAWNNTHGTELDAAFNSVFYPKTLSPAETPRPTEGTEGPAVDATPLEANASIASSAAKEPPAAAEAALGGIVFRPALQKQAARIINDLLEEGEGGALSRILSAEQWNEFALGIGGIMAVPELTEFLVNHVRLLTPVDCPLGRGFFLAAEPRRQPPSSNPANKKEATTSVAPPWPAEAATELLEFKMRQAALENALFAWEDELKDLKASGASHEAATERIVLLDALIRRNKLMQIEYSKLALRLASEPSPAVVLDTIRQRLDHFPDAYEVPVTTPFE